ncbi:MAG: YabP/YqfC family sporulation protein [Clostridia bacterium]
MAYKDEVAKYFDGKLLDNVWGHKVTIIDDILIVEGHKGILVFDAECVKLRLSNKIIVVNGKEFVILASNNSDLIAQGKIRNIEVQE